MSRNETKWSIFAPTRYAVLVQRKWVWAALWGLNGTLGACSSNDHPPPIGSVHPLPECPDLDYSTCDARQRDCQQRLLALATCVYGADDVPDVPVRVVSEQQLLDELLESSAADPDADDAADLVHIERALVDLKLLQAGDLTQDGGSTAQIVDGIDGVYQDAEHGIALVDRGAPKDTVDVNSVLVHEFVHALQDAQYNLQTWRQQYPNDTDTSLALRTVSEGQAMYAQYRVILAMAGDDVTRVDWERTLGQFKDNLMRRALSDASPYFASITTFPYAYGVGLAREAWSDHAGQFAAPPQTTWDVLTHGPGDSFTAPKPIELPAPTPDADSTFVDQTVLGALLLELAAHQLGYDVTQALDLGAAWRGDRLFIYAGPNEQTAWTWQLQLDDAQQASAFLQLALGNGVAGTARGQRLFLTGSDATETPAFLLDAGNAFLDAP